VLGSDDPADCSGCYEGFDAKGLEGSEELVDGGVWERAMRWMVVRGMLTT